jgi:hypothetical protein
LLLRQFMCGGIVGLDQVCQRKVFQLALAGYIRIIGTGIWNGNFLACPGVGAQVCDKVNS